MSSTSGAALPAPNLLHLEGRTSVRIPPPKKRGCELLLDFKMGTPNRPLHFFFFFFNYLAVPTSTEIGVGQQFIHLTLYFCHFLLGSVLHLSSGTLGTEGVGRNKI